MKASYMLKQTFFSTKELLYWGLQVSYKIYSNYFVK